MNVMTIKMIIPILITIICANNSVNAITALDFDAIPYKLPFPPVLEGPLRPNTLLTNAQFLLKGQVTGPESVHVEDSGATLYTTTLDGKILKIVEGQIVQTMRIKAINGNQTCGTYDTETIFGRPLGIRRLNQQYLIVADAYFGIYKLDFANASVEQIFSAEQKIDGEKCAFFNDLDVIADNSSSAISIFFSCTSTRWDRRRFMHDFLEGQPTGSLVRMDLDSGAIKIVVRNLNFANGVQAHPDGQSVLVNECSRARIVRFYFAGQKKGKTEIFAENLPGFPDNIRLSHNGTSFFVAISAVRHSNLVTFVDKLGPFPYLRWAAVQFFPENNLAPFFFTNMLKRQGLVLELDLNGNAIRTYQDTAGSIISSVSEASDDGNYLYLGSIFADFIAKVPKV